jgi:hypothetical protein
MASDLDHGHHRPGHLLTLPNEMLYNIIASLSPPDIRQLGQVNRRLFYCVKDYRYRTLGRIIALPDTIVLNIVEYLGLTDCSRLARSTSRFYALILDHVIHRNIQDYDSSLLTHAAIWNRPGLMRKILRHGGNVNTMFDDPRFDMFDYWADPTPLNYATYWGHADMVKLLFEFGASYLVDEWNNPLEMAMLEGYEEVALIHAHAVDALAWPSYPSRHKPSFMRNALRANFMKLARFLLGCRPRMNMVDSDDLDAALYTLLEHTIFPEPDISPKRDDFVERSLHQEDYEIVLLMLHHNANPDYLYYDEVWHGCRSARVLAKEHPDPRIRALLSTKKEEPQQSDSHIGRSWSRPSPHSIPMDEPETEEICTINSASLWDYHKETDRSPSLKNTAALTATKANTRRGSVKNAVPAIPKSMGWLKSGNEQDSKTVFADTELASPLTYAQLDTPQARIQYSAQLWQNVSAEIRSSKRIALPLRKPKTTSSASVTGWGESHISGW